MRPPPPGAPPWLVVDVLGEVRTLERESVREVARLVDLTPVPGAPPSVRGVTHLHGRIVAVLDPRHDGRGALAAEARPQLGDPLLLLEGRGEAVALWATRVREPARHEPLDAANALDVEALLVAARGSSPAREGPLEQAPALIADHEMVALQDF